VGGPGGEEGREEVRASEGEGDVVDDEVAGHDGDGEGDTEGAAAPRRLQRERDGDEHHDQVDPGEGQLRVELHRVLLDLVAGGLQPGDVLAQLPVAHRGDRLVDLREVVHVLPQVDGGQDEGDRLDLAAWAELPEGAVGELPAFRAPVSAPGV